jgi:predicted glycogen debranching enzyme
MKDGVMPSDLPEDGSAPRYGGADVSLWFVHAVHEYLRYRGDEALVQKLLPAVDQIIDWYRRGTGLGIGMDADGLLRSEEPGQPTTWMDAKVGDWIITPRRGRPVSVNALWYNALRVAADLASRFGQSKRAEELLALALRVKDAFNQRYWNAATNCCFDVVGDVPETNDPAIRPNQIFAISLPYAVLESSRFAAVLEKIRTELLTRFGLRTLSSADEHYQGHYAGPPVARDRAYHQGSVYPWLLGAYVSAYVKVAGRTDNTRREVRRVLDGCIEYMQGDGIGQLCELFDGDAPHKPGGAIASARSVAEVLRAYVEDVLEVAPVNGMRPVMPRPVGPVVGTGMV